MINGKPIRNVSKSYSEPMEEYKKSYSGPMEEYKKNASTLRENPMKLMNPFLNSESSISSQRNSNPPI